MQIKKQIKLAFLLGLFACLMFGFSFALVPLYDVFCKVTGLNGKVDKSDFASGSRYRITEDQIVDRLVTIEFDVNRHSKVGLQIIPQHQALLIKPGALTFTSYTVKNLTDKKMIIQAIPSISPGKVAKYLKKLECFCFTPQTLKPYETATLPLKFWLEPEFPDDVHRLTLSYTLFDVTEHEKEKRLGT